MTTDTDIKQEQESSKSWWCSECERFHPAATHRYDIGGKHYCKKGYDKLLSKTFGGKLKRK